MVHVDPATSTMLEHALAYLGRGLPVFPVCGVLEHNHADSSGQPVRCTNRGKVPLVQWKAFQDRLPTEAEAQRWWSHRPEANIGLATGHLSGIVVLDLDGARAVREALSRGYANGPHAFTGRVGGQHRYFEWRPDAPRNFAKRNGIDYRGEGGYVILPPSRHASGRQYVWGEALGDELPELPYWVDEIGAAGGLTGPAPAIEAEIGVGQRNATLTSLAGTMRRRGASEGAILAALRIENDARCRPPLDDQELRTIARSVARYAPDTSAQASEQANPENRAKQAFVWTTLGQLLEEPEEVVPFIVGRMLPSGGVSMFVAKPKVGKSTAARNLALAVSTGEPFLGRDTTAGPVIYLALEEKRAEVANHFRRMGASDQDVLVHVGAAPASTEEAILALEAAIVERGAILAIADPALKLVRVRDASDYAEMMRALEPVVELARRTKCHISLCHHAGKLERPGGDDVLGSTALFGSVDTLVLMRRREYGRTLETIQRYGQDQAETVIPLDEHTGLVQLGGDVESIKLAKASDGIRQVLATLKADEDLDEAAIRGQVEAASAVTARALRVLVAEDALIRRGGGKRGDPYRYRLAPDSRFLDFPICAEQENEKTELRCELCEEPLGGGESPAHESCLRAVRS